MATSKPKAGQSKPSWAQIIATVQTPLGFFVLVVLVVEAIFGAVAAMSSGPERTYLVVGMLVLIFALIIIVAVLAVLRPESLQGQRPTEAHGASSVAQITKISKPQILCAATPEGEKIGFEYDVEIIQQAFRSGVHVEHNLSASRL